MKSSWGSQSRDAWRESATKSPASSPPVRRPLKKSASLEADLVLMDIRLQGPMSGIEAATLIRDSTRVPVVYLTAYSDADTLEKAKLTEPYGFILKPFEERALEATVKMALSRSRSQQELQRTHDKLASILHSVGDAIIVTELNGTILYANTRARQLLRLPSPLPPFSQIFPHLRLTVLGHAGAALPASRRGRAEGPGGDHDELQSRAFGRQLVQSGYQPGALSGNHGRRAGNRVRSSRLLGEGPRPGGSWRRSLRAPPARTGAFSLLMTPPRQASA